MSNHRKLLDLVQVHGPVVEAGIFASKEPQHRLSRAIAWFSCSPWEIARWTASCILDLQLADIPSHVGKFFVFRDGFQIKFDALLSKRGWVGPTPMQEVFDWVDALRDRWVEMYWLSYDDNDQIDHAVINRKLHKCHEKTEEWVYARRQLIVNLLRCRLPARWLRRYFQRTEPDNAVHCAEGVGKIEEPDINLLLGTDAWYFGELTPRMVRDRAAALCYQQERYPAAAVDSVTEDPISADGFAGA